MLCLTWDEKSRDLLLEPREEGLLGVAAAAHCCCSTAAQLFCCAQMPQQRI